MTEYLCLADVIYPSERRKQLWYLSHFNPILTLILNFSPTLSWVCVCVSISCWWKSMRHIRTIKVISQAHMSVTNCKSWNGTFFFSLLWTRVSAVDISWADSSSDGGTALRRSLQAIYGALSLHRVAIRAHIPSCHNILLYSFDLGQVVLKNIYMDSRFTTCDK